MDDHEHLAAFAAAGQRLLSILTPGTDSLAVFELLTMNELRQPIFVPFVPPSALTHGPSDVRTFLADIKRLVGNADRVPPSSDAATRLQRILQAKALLEALDRHRNPERFGWAEIRSLVGADRLEAAREELRLLLREYSLIRIPPTVGASAVIYHAWRQGLIDPNAHDADGLVQPGDESRRVVDLVQEMAQRIGFRDANLSTGKLDGSDCWKEPPPGSLALWTEYSLVHRLDYTDATEGLVMIHYPLVVHGDWLVGFAYHLLEADAPGEAEYARCRSILNALFEEPFKLSAYQAALQFLDPTDEDRVGAAARVIYPCFEVDRKPASPGDQRVQVGGWSGVLPVGTTAKNWLVDELALLNETLVSKAATLENQREAERLAESAAQMQRSRTEAAPEHSTDYEFGVFWQPARLNGISGDFYGAVLTDDGSYVAYVGDIEGKGAPALYYYESYRIQVARLAKECPDLRTMLMHLHSWAQQYELRQLDYAIARFETESCAICSSGTVSATVVRADGTCQPINANCTQVGMSLGVFGVDPFVTTIAAGESVVFLSDGVSDTKSASGDTLDPAIINRAVWRARKEGPRSMTARIGEALDQFRGTGLRSDDVTVLVVQKREAP